MGNVRGFDHALGFALGGGVLVDGLGERVFFFEAPLGCHLEVHARCADEHQTLHTMGFGSTHQQLCGPHVGRPKRTLASPGRTQGCGMHNRVLALDKPLHKGILGEVAQHVANVGCIDAVVRFEGPTCGRHRHRLVFRQPFHKARAQKPRRARHQDALGTHAAVGGGTPFL